MRQETFALSRAGSAVDLWCRDEGPANGGGRRFWVINGAWTGVYHNGVVSIPGFQTSWPATEVWRGVAPGFNDADYNEAMAWIAEQIAPHD